MKGEEGGIPPDGNSSRPNAEINLQYLHAIRSAARAEDFVFFLKRVHVNGRGFGHATERAQREAGGQKEKQPFAKNCHSSITPL